MRSRLVIGVAALLSAGVIPNIANATVVYVTYTGAVVTGTDPGGVFGQNANLSGNIARRASWTPIIPATDFVASKSLRV
jgi:hypothetical protein